MSIKRKAMSLTITLFMVSAVVFVGAESTPAKSRPGIEGTWVVTVNLESPPPGFSPSFTALETYSSGGGLVTSNNLPPVSRPGQGQFSKERAHRYSVVIRFFLFDQNGAPAGRIRVSHNIEILGSDRYAGIGRADFFDNAGNLFLSVPFTTEGRRLEVE